MYVKSSVPDKQMILCFKILILDSAMTSIGHVFCVIFCIMSMLQIPTGNGRCWSIFVPIHLLELSFVIIACRHVYSGLVGEVFPATWSASTERLIGVTQFFQIDLNDSHFDLIFLYVQQLNRSHELHTFLAQFVIILIRYVWKWRLQIVQFM